MTAELLIDGGDNEQFDVDMDEANFQAMVNTLANVDAQWVRRKAYKNHSLRNFLNSSRFLLEYARHTGATKRLPPPAWLKYQMTNQFFPIGYEKPSFNLKEIVLDKTRHGFGEVDIPFDTAPGVKPIQDLGGCEAACLLRNVFIVENMNHPILRVEPTMFAQIWSLVYIRPKFVFRGLVACPKGDYGLAQFIIEIGDTADRKIRSNISVAFKKGDETRTGHFIPFEIESPDYDFRPDYIYVFIMAFYVKKIEIVNPGFRLANCTFQCKLPDEVVPLTRPPRYEPVPQYNQDQPPTSMVFRSSVTESEPEYQRMLREHFYSVVDNATMLRDEESTIAMREMENMMSGRLLDEPMDEDMSDEECDLRENPKKRRDDLEEPDAKRRR